MQSGMTALLLACAAGHEEAGQMLAAPTQAADAIDVLVCAWVYAFFSLSHHQCAGMCPSMCWYVHGYTHSSISRSTCLCSNYLGTVWVRTRLCTVTE